MNEVMDLNMKVINSVKDFEQKKKSNGIEDIANFESKIANFKSTIQILFYISFQFSLLFRL